MSDFAAAADSRAIGRILIIGIGNPHRSDDGAGPRLAEMLAPRLQGMAEVRTQSGEGTGLMALWSEDDAVILLDAAFSDKEPGEVTRFDALTGPVPYGFFNYSTHNFSVAEAIEMSRVLNTLPAAMLVYGIEGGSFGAGLERSPEVDAVLPGLADDIVAEVTALHTRMVDATGA